MNQCESQALELLLTERGHTICGKDDDFDAFIVNTCAVTAESGRKSRQIIRQLKQSHPDAVCAVCGCFSQISPESVREIGADVISGSGDRLLFVDQLEQALNFGTKSENIDKPLRRRVFESLPSGNIGTRTRATLKIQDGCSNFCTYCIIPYARGPIRSLPISDAASQAKGLKDMGYKEIVITGIEIASYGRDLKDKSTLADVVEKIADAAPGVRLRLGSLEPRIITEDFCRRMSRLPSLCPHFHLSLQSGCDSVLKRMNRKYSTEDFYASVSLLRSYFPHCGLTADLIVGFPGETQEEFDDTISFIKKCRFSSMHIFPYSRRPGTPANQMDGQISSAEKHNRAIFAGKVASDMTHDYLAFCVGKVFSVLFEQEKDGFQTGHAENYVQVKVSAKGLRNQIRNVVITGHDGTSLIGDIVNEN